MLKKIALVGVFSIASVLSFNAPKVSASSIDKSPVQPITPRGLCASAFCTK